MYILYVGYLIFLGYIAIIILLLMILAVAGQTGKADDPVDSAAPRLFRKIGVLTPAYKEDAVIVEPVLTNLKQTCFDLIVIADSMTSSVRAKLAKLPICVIKVLADTTNLAT